MVVSRIGGGGISSGNGSTIEAGGNTYWAMAWVALVGEETKEEEREAGGLAPGGTGLAGEEGREDGEVDGEI